MGEYEDRLWKEFDLLGESEVRLRYRRDVYIAPQARAAVEEWLHLREESRSDASKREDKDLAREANLQAKKANTIAIIAIIISAIATIVAIISLAHK